MLTFSRGLKPHSRPVSRVMLHCSDSRPETTVEDIHRWHLGKGWSGIGYHWIVDAAGQVHEGRPEAVIGAGAMGHNDGVIHVCMIGMFDARKPSEVQWQATLQLLRERLAAHKLDHRAVLLHRDVDRQGKTCPGEAIDKADVVAGVKAC